MNFHFTLDAVLFFTVAYILCIDLSAKQMPDCIRHTVLLPLVEQCPHMCLHAPQAVGKNFVTYCSIDNKPHDYMSQNK